MTIINDETGEEYESIAHLLADELGGDIEDYQTDSDIPFPDLNELRKKDVTDAHEHKS